MKKLGLLILIYLMTATIINSQSLDDYRSKQNGNWNSTSSWERYDGTNWINATLSPTSANGEITIRNTHTITITETVTYDQVTVEQGGQITVASSSISTTLSNGPGTDLIINGTWLNQGGTWNTGGTTWTVTSTGTFIHNSPYGIETPLNSATLDATSNFIYRGSPSLKPPTPMSGRTYGNISFESAPGGWLAPTIVNGAGTLTVLGNFYISSGVVYNTNQTGLMSFAGNFTIDGTLNNGTGTQSYNFTGINKSIGGSTSTLSFENITIANGASYNLNRDINVLSGFTLTVDGELNCSTANIIGNGNFTLSSGGTLGIGSASGITTSGSIGNVQVSGTRLFNDGANYVYNGTETQNTGNALPSTLLGAHTIDNISGVTLSQSMISNGTINLTNGALITGANNFNAGGTVTRTNGIVNGNLVKSLTAGGTYTYEVGTSATKYTPVVLSNVVGSGTFTVNAISGPHPNAVGANVLQIYWELTNGGLTSADLTFNYLDADVVGDETKYELGRYDGNWAFLSPFILNTTANTVSISGINTFSDWTLGEHQSLPVELTSFEAVTIGTIVKLSWNTATEVNNYGFEIERASSSTTPSQEWESIGFVEGHGNSNSPKDYSFIDKEVLRGKYSYRLKQIDTDGKFEYSKVIEVTIENIPLNFELLQNFPNPFNPVTKIKYSIPDGTLRHAQSDNFVVLKVYDVLGNEIATLVNEYQEAGSYEVSFEAASLASGLYLYILNVGSFIETKKMVLLR